MYMFVSSVSQENVRANNKKRKCSQCKEVDIQKNMLFLMFYSILHQILVNATHLIKYSRAHYKPTTPSVTMET